MLECPTSAPLRKKWGFSFSEGTIFCDSSSLSATRCGNRIGGQSAWTVLADCIECRAIIARRSSKKFRWSFKFSRARSLGALFSARAATKDQEEQ
jgi:hypothetical protein